MCFTPNPDPIFPEFSGAAACSGRFGRSVFLQPYDSYGPPDPGSSLGIWTWEGLCPIKPNSQGISGHLRTFLGNHLSGIMEQTDPYLLRKTGLRSEHKVLVHLNALAWKNFASRSKTEAIVMKTGAIICFYVNYYAFPSDIVNFE